MAFDIATATVDELRLERQRINDRIRKGGLTAGQLRNAQNNVNSIKQRLASLQQSSVVDSGTGYPVDATVVDTSGNAGNQGQTWTASDGTVFNNFNDYIRYEELIETRRQFDEDKRLADARQAEIDRLQRQFEEEQKAVQVTNARESLRTLLKEFFFDSEDALIEDVLRAAEEDFKIGLDSEVIIKKMQDYENPNSIFARRFAGNVALRKQGIEPLDARTYLSQERTYRGYLDAVGLSDLASRDNFSTWIGGRVSPTEVQGRIDDVFNIWDGADAAFKLDLETALGVNGIMARNEVAKALLLGPDNLQKLSRKVATAGVATEARVRGLGVGSAEQLAAAGVTREEARTGFERIRGASPIFQRLSNIYDQASPGATEVQSELESEVFLGMQSQRRKRLAERERAAFSGSSGLSGSALSQRPTAGQI